MRSFVNATDLRRAAISLSLFCLVSGWVIADEGGRVPTDEIIVSLIKQLESKQFAVRQAAHQKLVEIGKPARPLLRVATKHGSAEKTHRARAILREMLGRGLVVYLPDEVTGRTDGGRSPSSDKSSSMKQGVIASPTIKFPESGPLVIRDRSAIDTDFHFTIMAWIRPDRIIHRNAKAYEDRRDQPLYPWGHGKTCWAGHFIACKWSSVGHHGDFIFAITPSGRLGLGVSNSATRSFSSDSHFTEDCVPTARWTHVAATFSRGEIGLLIDGELVASKQSTTILHTNRQEYARDDLYVGGFWNQTVIDNESLYDFQGEIAELCLFNRRLSTGEIQDVMRMTQLRPDG